MTVPNAFQIPAESFITRNKSKEHRVWRQPGTHPRNMPEIQLPGSLTARRPEMMTKRKKRETHPDT